MSSPRPPSTLSVVAATFPPFRCRSHAMLRRSRSGKILWIESTFATSTGRPALALDEEPELLAEAPPAGLERYHRMARKPTRATARSCGILIEVWLCWLLVCAIVGNRMSRSGGRGLVARVAGRGLVCSPLTTTLYLSSAPRSLSDCLAASRRIGRIARYVLEALE